MSNYLAKSANGHDQSTAKAIQLGLQTAMNKGCSLLLLSPGIQNAKNSDVLESALGSAAYKQIVNQRGHVQIPNTNNTISLETISTMKHGLSAFDGVIVGLWTSSKDADTISATAKQAKDVILVEWADSELDPWSGKHNATII
ncbi:hypothetical protein P9A10_16200 [Serratia marcescens]|uniref:hypothetical protein n=1 Tax=Serratia TaxID=613 RepID=UPI00129479D7|nr:hypothetical protein [Serratia marcescens]